MVTWCFLIGGYLLDDIHVLLFSCRLPILSCFPETLHPDCYSSLLPIYESQFDGDDCGVMEEWEGKEPRSMDWVEHPDIR